MNIVRLFGRLFNLGMAGIGMLMMLDVLGVLVFKTEPIPFTRVMILGMASVHWLIGSVAALFLLYSLINVIDGMLLGHFRFFDAAVLALNFAMITAWIGYDSGHFPAAVGLIGLLAGMPSNLSKSVAAIALGIPR